LAIAEIGNYSGAGGILMRIQQFLLTFIFIANSILFVAASPSAGADMNVIKSIKTTPSGVDIEIYSSRPFPVRALPPVLRMGSKEFMISRNPEDGSLNSLIFTLTPTEFAQVSTGDPVVVQYGAGMAPEDRWDFPRLDKSLVNK
jgi:hypothetical protein